MKRKGVGLLVMLLLTLLLTGCCKHEWVEATCTAPRSCSICGKTDGEPSPHSFTVISCADPMVCSVCGVEGEVPGHTWADATCTEPKTCTICHETEDEALGHSTRYGTCTRCTEFVDNLEYKDGFAVITYSDTSWMQERDSFTDVYLAGTIVDISRMNEVSVVDLEGKTWTVDVGNACDLSVYMNTVCEVYGFSSGGISSQHNTPLINMDHEDNCIVFADGKELYPENYESVEQFPNKYTGNTSTGSGILVWIPANGGTKYHSRSNCSKMDNPVQVTDAEAISRGFGKCGRCW